MDMDWEKYTEALEKESKETMASIIETRNRLKKMSRKERKAVLDATNDRPDDLEAIDANIYAVDHGLAYDGFYDITGYRLGESWEQYKKKAGYYKRHPEELAYVYNDIMRGPEEKDQNV